MFGRFPARSGFTTFCHQKVAPKVSAGHLRRDRTKAVSERSRKTPLVARSLRAFHPLSDLLPPPVQCGGCCALHATMVYSDVILLYSIQQASGLPDRTAKRAERFLRSTAFRPERQILSSSGGSPNQFRHRHRPLHRPANSGEKGRVRSVFGTFARKPKNNS